MNFIKLFFIFIFILVAFFSCNQSKISDYEKEIETLQNEITLKDSIINTSSKSNYYCSKKLESTEKLISESVNQHNISNFLENGILTIDKKKLLQRTVNEIDINKLSIIDALSYSLFHKRNTYLNIHMEHNSTKDNNLHNLLWNQIDRSSESITDFFYTNEELIIHKLLDNNTLYKNSGIAAIVKSLLVSYEEINLDKQSKLYLQDLIKNLYKTNTPFDDNHWEAHRIIEEKLASKKIKEFLSIENYSSYNIKYTKIENRLFYVYSFWARRYKEGNQEIVYHILNQFHQNISNQ